MKNERGNNLQTIPIYETNGLIMEFEAVVISCKEISEGKHALILDKTAFFPEGGGQDRDEGFIENSEVTDLFRDTDGNIVHIVDASYQEGDEVACRLDKELRLSRMQNHSAEHIISGLIHNRFGYDNVGFHMSKKEVTLDVSGPISMEELAAIEKEANEIVYRDLPIVISFPTEDEAKNIDYRSKLEIVDGLRLVTIEGVDTCACCAPHVATTGQIGAIKILAAMPHRQGMRITMIAGLDAFDDYKMLHEDNRKIMALLSSKREDTAEFVEALLSRNNALKEENTRLKKEMTAFITQEVVERIKKRKDSDESCEVIFTNALDNVGLRNLINSCTDIFTGVVLGFIGNDDDGYKYIIGCNGDKNAGDIAKKINAGFSGKGGGNTVMAQGSIQGRKKEIEEFVKTL